MATFFSERSRSGYEASELAPELLALTAAEFALEPVLDRPRRVVPAEQPINVAEQHARVAIVKCNCLSLLGCVGPLSWQPLTFPDVMAFAADITKLAAAGVPVTDPPSEIGDIARAVAVIEGMHRDESAPAHVQAVGASGVLRLQGFLWAVKLSLPRRALDEAVAEAYDAFELMHPTGASEPVPA
jgi:hypothetical protein